MQASQGDTNSSQNSSGEWPLLAWVGWPSCSQEMSWGSGQRVMRGYAHIFSSTIAEFHYCFSDPPPQAFTLVLQIG